MCSGTGRGAGEGCEVVSRTLYSARCAACFCLCVFGCVHMYHVTPSSGSLQCQITHNILLTLAMVAVVAP